MIRVCVRGGEAEIIIRVFYVCITLATRYELLKNNLAYIVVVVAKGNWDKAARVMRRDTRLHKVVHVPFPDKDGVSR